MTARDKNHSFDVFSIRPNLGVIDRTLRGGIALALVFNLFLMEGAISAADVALMAVGILLGTTVACGWDPLYQMLGWSTREDRLLARFRRTPRRSTPAPARSLSETDPEGPGPDFRKAA